MPKRIVSFCASARGKINREEGESHCARSAHYEVTFIHRLLTWSQGDSETSQGESLSIKWIITSYIQRIMGASNVFQVRYHKTNYRLLWLAKCCKILKYNILFFSLTLSGFLCSHQRDRKLWDPLCSLGITVNVCAAVLQDYCGTAALYTKTNLGSCTVETFGANN